MRQPVFDALSEHGAVLWERDAIADGTAAFDGLICLADEANSDEVKKAWLHLVNRAATDLLLSTDGRRVVPAEMTMWLRERRDLGEQIALAIKQLADARMASLVSPRLPRILELPEDLCTPDTADCAAALHSRLGDESNLVIGVRTGTVQALAAVRAKSRAEYDVARYVRWSQDRLDQSFVKLTMRLVGGEAATNALATKVRSLAEVLSDRRSSNFIIVRGAPGAGKSLQLRYLETTHALDSIRAGSDEDMPLPFCVALGEHATSNADPMTWLDARWARRMDVTVMQPFRRNLEVGRMHLFLDGFNEIPFTNTKDRMNWMLRWRSLIQDELLQTSSNAVVLACRTKDLGVPMATDDYPVTSADMVALTDSDILEIAGRRNPRAAHELETAFGRDPTLADLYRTPFTLSVYLDDDTPGVPQTQSEVFVRRIKSTLARERDSLNMRVFDDRWLPDEAVRIAVDETPSSDADATVASLTVLPLMKALGQFAHDLMKSGSGRNRAHAVAVSIDKAQAMMRKYLGLSEDDAGLAAINVAVELDLLRTNEGVVSFRHHSLQEFFAASTLTDEEIATAVEVRSEDFAAKLGVLESVISALGPGDELPVLPPTGFEEVAVKACELRPQLLRRLAVANPWLAAEISKSFPAHAVENDRADIVHGLETHLGSASDVRERISTLSWLGRLVSAPTASERFITIPGQSWELGCDDHLLGVLSSGSRLRTVRLDEFAIGMFAVTNAEYDRFVKSDGYFAADWWSLEGRSWKDNTTPLDDAVARWLRRRDHVAERPSLPADLLGDKRVSLTEAAAIVRFGEMSDQEIEEIVAANASEQVRTPAFWSHERFDNPLQPVVGVSYYEAEAYCRWRSTQDGFRYRLPTEDEWEAAALFALSRGRVAGDETLEGAIATRDVSPPVEWDPTWGNTAELQLGRPSAVGAFNGMADVSAGVAPADLFGNVFEWTADLFRPGEDSRRVCKGGSWRHLIRRAVPGYRGRGDLATRNDDDGFRIIREPRRQP
jgi:formylglycine-generating enzyme required for sulfatase activity